MTEKRNHDLAVRMAELARAAAAPRSVEDVLSDVTTNQCHGEHLGDHADGGMR